MVKLETPQGCLRWHWGGAYMISHAGGVWAAQRRDDRQTIVRDSPEALHEAIIADYTARPVPRGRAPLRGGGQPGTGRPPGVAVVFRSRGRLIRRPGCEGCSVVLAPVSESAAWLLRSSAMV
jgi:hypothetical protein